MNEPVQGSTKISPGLGHVAENIVNCLRSPVLVLDDTLTVHEANAAYYEHFCSSPELMTGKHIDDLEGAFWHNPDLLSLLNKTIHENAPFENFIATIETGADKQHIMSISGRRIDDMPLIFLTFDDVTGQRQLHQKLQDTVKQLGALIDASSDVVYKMSPDWSEMKQLIGREFIADTDEPNRTWLEKYIPPEEQAEVLAAIERAIRNKAIFELKHRVLRPDGTLGWTFSRAIPVRDEQGEIVEWLGMAKDITDRIEAEQQLLAVRQMERFKALAEMSPQAILVNVDDQWQYANAAAAKLFKVDDSSSIVGLKTLDIICSQFHAQVQDELKKVRDGEGVSEPLECCLLLFDGTPFDVELFVGISTWDGTPSIQVIAHDITQRKTNLKLLEERKARLRELADAMPQLVWTANPDGQVTYYNERYHEVVGLSLRPDGFWDWEGMVCDEHKEHTARLWAETIRTGNDYQNEVKLHCCDGVDRWFLSRAIPMRNNSGEIERWIGTTTDIDLLKKTEMALFETIKLAEESSRAKSDFVAKMSHEIRTPMTVFLSALEILLSSDMKPEHLKILQMADKSAKSLRALIDDILDYSRIDAKKYALHNAPFDLYQCVKDAADMFSLQALKKGLKLNFESTMDHPLIFTGDIDATNQILNNLLNNAIKFTETGEITISLRTIPNAVEISVADTGIGIPDDQFAMIFDSFHQADSDFNRKHGGSGLGLAICKGLTELMGGMISVQNRKEGGAEFIVTLPRTDSLPADKGKPERTTIQIMKTKQSNHILLVEDDLLIQEIISLALSEEGFYVEIANDGEEALEKWRRGEFDLILMDVQIPKRNGIETTLSIRNREGEGKHIPIIGLTAHAGVDVFERCLGAGMNQVMSKPIKLDELYSSVDKCLTHATPGSYM